MTENQKENAEPGIAVLDPRLHPPHGSIGVQYDSKKDTMPAYSFGTGTREVAANKVFISKDHNKLKLPMPSPGPVYKTPTTVGAAPKFSFGCDEQRKHAKADYPDTSVDLTCSVVDNQSVKFSNASQIHFGTEARGCLKNAETVRVNPSLVLGLDSPGALEYTPEKADPKCVKTAPEYSFGPDVKKDKKESKTDKTPQKPVTRLHIPATGTPRHVGPGSHGTATHSMGHQLNSARGSAPSYSFGSTPRMTNMKKCGQLFDISHDFSSLGKQLVSTQKTMPTCTFGDATRDKVGKSQIVMCTDDRGPAAHMPKPNFHYDLPRLAPGKPLPATGM